MAKDIDRHHLLEIILWPNGDGTFRTILNSRKKLKELGIYHQYKMTIAIPKSEHSKLHGAYKPKVSDESRRKMSESAKGNHSHLGHKGTEKLKNWLSSRFRGKSWSVVNGRRVWT